MVATLVSKRIINCSFPRIHTKASLISKRIIKPISPTPKSLSCYNLSSSDQTLPNIYVPFAFFYPSVTNQFERTQISQQIENGLSKTLASYYPFAGRLVENHHISCNDAGINFQEIQINSSMSEIFKKSQEDIVFPRGLQWSSIQNPIDHSLVFVQLNYFDCGGVAISFCMSHKIADGSTFGTFVNDLATMSCQENYVPSPRFISNTIFPPVENPISFPPNLPTNGISKRVIFHAEKIAALKTLANNLGIEKPTRVEVVTALLYQRALASSDSSLVRQSILIQPINLRPLIGLRPDSVGNIWAMNILVTKNNQMSFQEMVNELRKSKVKIQNIYKQKLNSSSPMQDMLRDFFHLVGRGGFDVYHCSSNCRFPYYEVDFGWGKPIRVSIGQYPGKDTFFLIDTPENGIEALVNLDEQTMLRFEKDKELLSFASLCSTE
ncbi:hypothetical protein M9H77_19294 [Catharanthus roseus]|uniref:Uncharacterized protein n=1 Tax=Catharanthus roseus TaxID=4058 RepID=A0ACC0B9X1_CATRO|nr:hypothetical protein M9H77_19294 [Catharanthus roseus]